MTLSFSNRFTQLDQWLMQNQPLWRFDPFSCSFTNQALWKNEYPDLALFLDSLSADEISELKQDTPRLITQLSPFIPNLKQGIDLSQLTRIRQQGLALSPHLSAGIPGRKWQQITKMGEAALALSGSDLMKQENREWLEWCAGKGFLGRVLAHQSKQPVISIEWQQLLCDTGQQAADSLSLPMHFIQADVLGEFDLEKKGLLSAKAHLSEKLQHQPQHAVALHACGDLHTRLIEQTCQHQLHALTLSPCCYHLTQNEQYQALSDLGKQSPLKLSRTELRIPLQETVTGGTRVQRHRQQEMSYRLALDCLLREKLEHSSYTPLPSIKKSQLSEGFTAFCEWANTQKPLNIPLEDLDDWLAKGEARYIEMERLSLIQQVFRRPLEMWLTFDKALYLQQAGYEVNVATFCDREVTPRNILIQAHLNPNH